MVVMSDFKTESLNVAIHDGIFVAVVAAEVALMTLAGLLEGAETDTVWETAETGNSRRGEKELTTPMSSDEAEERAEEDELDSLKEGDSFRPPEK